MTIATNLNCSPFEIFDQDTDEVIMLINFYLYLGEKGHDKNHKKETNGKEKRIRVNDQTATGGWW